MQEIDKQKVKNYLLRLQDDICSVLQSESGIAWREDNWTRDQGGGGRSRVAADDADFEKVGVSFSHVQGDQLPPTASQSRPELAGRRWQAMGVSLVIHPQNPYVPTAHANVRFFIA